MLYRSAAGVIEKQRSRKRREKEDEKVKSFEGRTWVYIGNANVRAGSFPQPAGGRRRQTNEWPGAVFSAPLAVVFTI